MTAEGWLTPARAWRRFVPERLRSGGVANAITLGGGTAIGQGLVVLAAPIITRLYAPSDVALFGLIVSFVTFASVGLSLRYDLAIVAALDDAEANTLLCLSLFLTLLMSGVAAVLLGWLITEHMLSYGVLPLQSTIAMFAILVLIGGISALRYWYVRRGEFGLISRALVAQGAGRTVVSIGAGFLHVGWVGLLAGEVVGRSLGGGRMLRGAWPAIRAVVHHKFAGARAALSRNRKYAMIVFPSSLLDSASTVISIPIVIGLFGRTDGGQFFLVQNMLGLPAALVANSVADVLHARLAEAYLSDPVQLSGIIRRAFTQLAKVAILIYTPIALVAPFVVTLILGSRWGHAGIIATLLAPYMITSVIVNPTSRVLVVVNRSEWKLIVDVIRLVVPPAALYACQHVGWGLLPSLLVYSLVSAGANGVYMLIIWRVSFVSPFMSRVPTGQI